MIIQDLRVKYYGALQSETIPVNQDGATSINNNKYLITYLIKEYGQMHFIQECIVNSQNVFNCVYVQADNLIQYEENLPSPPRFLLLQHLAVDVNALTRNVFTGFRLLLCFSFTD